MARKRRGGSTVGYSHEKQKNGSTYVYSCVYSYDPNTQRTHRDHRTLVGKILPGGTEIVPTRPKKPSVENREQASGIQGTRVRATLEGILDWAGEASGVDSDLLASMSRGDALKTASFARFLTATGGDTTPGIDAFQREHPLPYPEMMTPDACYELFAAIGRDEGIRQAFFASRAARLGPSPLLALDSTLEGTCSDEQLDARYVKHGLEQHLKKVRFVAVHAVETMEPVAFVKVPGNMQDGATLACVVEQLKLLGIRSPRLVTDNGCWNEASLGIMAHEGISFIALAKPSISWIADKVEEASETIRSIGHLSPDDDRTYVQTFRVKHTFQWERKHASARKGLAAGDRESFERVVSIHVCFDPIRKEQRDVEFFEEVRTLREQLLEGVESSALTPEAQEMAAKYLVASRSRGGRTGSIGWNEDACRNACRAHGFFVLVSNREKDGFAALRKYRRREYVEGFFGRWKGGADGRRPRVWHANELMGRMTVQFAALCLSEHLRRRIRQMRTWLADELDTAAKKGEAPSRHKVDRGLLRWLEKTSFLSLLRWFDAYENYEAGSKIRSARWNTAATERDKRFLELLKSLPIS